MPMTYEQLQKDYEKRGRRIIELEAEMKKGGIDVIRAEVLAISADLHKQKIELAQIAEDRDGILTLLGAIEGGIGDLTKITEARFEQIVEGLGLDKLRRIEVELEGYDFEKVEKLYPEVHVRAALAAILEILAE